MATRNSEAGGTTSGSGGTSGGQKPAGAGSAGAASGASAGGSRAGGGKAGAKRGGTGTGAKKATGTRAGAGKAADTSTGSRKATGTRGGTKTKKSAGSRGGGKAGKAAKKSGSSDGKASGGSAGGSQKLRSDLRGFVQAHPGGWGHNEWIGLVNLLKERGHDTSDTDAIGMALERERLTLVLERVPGLGAQRVKAIADKYPRIWNVMQAGAEELAMAANLPKALARKVKDALP